MKIKRLNPTPRWSDATSYNGIAHFVEVPEDTSVDMEAQIKQILRQADFTLAKINSNKANLLSATIYITDLANLSLVNQHWEAWLPLNAAPSRACLKVGLVDPLMLVEIAFVAAVDV